MAPQAFDVIVFGLGAMGSAAAYHLAARGKRVLGLERYTPAHDRGSSHGDSRIIRQAYHEDPAYVPLVQRAYELWQQLATDSGADLLTLTGGLMIGRPSSSIVTGTLASAKEHGLPHQVLDAQELRRRFPLLRPRPGDIAVFEQRAGFLRPEAAVRAHMEQAIASGADLHFNEAVTGWHAGGDHVQVHTAGSTYTADRLVLTPGPWAPDLLRDLNISFEIRRHAMCWFQPENAAAFSPDRFPIYIWDVDGEHIFYGFPHTADGVKAAMHSGGDLCTAETVDRQVSQSDVDELRHYFARFVPDLDRPSAKAAACMYTVTPDEHFVVGLHPHFPRVAIAAGFSGHGFKFSTVIGEILADLATAGTTPHPIKLFSPQRPALSGPNA